jgi:hypothetical protein
MLSVTPLVTKEYKHFCLFLYSVHIGTEVLHGFEEAFQVGLIL